MCFSGFCFYRTAMDIKHFSFAKIHKFCNNAKEKRKKKLPNTGGGYRGYQPNVI
jgi:hypothetical protein